MRWVWIGLASIVYWLCALALLGVIIFLRGDCWAHGSEVERACVGGNWTISAIYLTLAILLFVPALLRAVRRARNKAGL